MSATAASVSAATRHDLSFGGVVRSEWIKLRSVRSTWWSYAVMVVVTVGVGAQMSDQVDFAWFDGEMTQIATQAAAVNALTISTSLNVLIVSVLGVLVIAGEYSTGMIRSTFTAVPRRVPALLAKLLVFAVVTLLVNALAVAIVIPLSTAIMTGNGVSIRLDDPDYWRVLIGTIGYLGAIGLIAFGIGAILRQVVVGVAAAIALVFVVPTAIGFVSGLFTSQVWLRNLTALMPHNLGYALTLHPGYDDFASPGSVVDVPDGLWVLEPWQGALGLVVWVVALLATAIVLLKRRDV